MTSAKLSVNGTEYTLPEVDGVTLQPDRILAALQTKVIRQG
jgi:hypothetical protein